VDVELTSDELRDIDGALAKITVQGERYRRFWRQWSIAEPQAGAIHTVIVGRRAGTWRRRRSLTAEAKPHHS